MDGSVSAMASTGNSSVFGAVPARAVARWAAQREDMGPFGLAGAFPWRRRPRADGKPCSGGSQDTPGPSSFLLLVGRPGAPFVASLLRS